MKKIFSCFTILLLSALTLNPAWASDARCSFEIVNNDLNNTSFSNNRATVGNLEIPACTEWLATVPERKLDPDEQTVATCTGHTDDVLYVHPRYDVTCASVLGQPVFLTVDGKTYRSSRTLERIDQTLVLVFQCVSGRCELL